MTFWANFSFSLLLIVILQLANAQNCLCDCNFAKGRWVSDWSYPLYNGTSCPFMVNDYNCQKNGRKDLKYLKYRWQPLSGRDCELQRFDGQAFLRRFQGKSIMFVGDDIGHNQWQSLTCLLYTAMPRPEYTLTRVDTITTFTLTDYKVKVMHDSSMFLVDLVRENKSRILKLDSIQGGKRWIGMDMIIFNSWQWWTREGREKPWDYIQSLNRVLKDMDRLKAFEKGLTIWGRWVDATIDPNKTMVFFLGIPPTHYEEWLQPRARGCYWQKTPFLGPMYPSILPPAFFVVRDVLKKMKKHVTLLDITELSQFRKDGHPSIYGRARNSLDCTHWCLAGVPDTWNVILYNLIFTKR